MPDFDEDIFSTKMVKISHEIEFPKIPWTGMSHTNRWYDRQNSNSLTAKNSLKLYRYHLQSILSYPRPYLTGSKRGVNGTDGK
jgi:hypothetical protein